MSCVTVRVIPSPRWHNIYVLILCLHAILLSRDLVLSPYNLCLWSFKHLSLTWILPLYHLSISLGSGGGGICLGFGIVYVVEAWCPNCSNLLPVNNSSNLEYCLLVNSFDYLDVEIGRNILS